MDEAKHAADDPVVLLADKLRSAAHARFAAADDPDSMAAGHIAEIWDNFDVKAFFFDVVRLAHEQKSLELYYKWEVLRHDDCMFMVEVGFKALKYDVNLPADQHAIIDKVRALEDWWDDTFSDMVRASVDAALDLNAPIFDQAAYLQETFGRLTNR